MMTSLLLAVALQGSPAPISAAQTPAGQIPTAPFAAWPNSKAVAASPGEGHLANIRQLTFGGQNAEAYWSKDGKRITFQSLQPGFPDEQIFVMGADGSGKRLVSTGLGRCTCSYFSPDGKEIYFSSTHATNEGPQRKIDRSKGYVWMVNPEFQMFRVDAARPGAKPKLVFSRKGYVAETTIDPAGRYLTFTSDFEGDLEIYRSSLNGKNVSRLTNDEGYDGGPFVSWDGSKIVYRRDTIDTPAEAAEYRTLLAEHLVRPGKLEIMLMDADGRNKRKVTSLGGASFAPFLSPDNKRIVFSTNFADPKGREFDLYVVNVDGTGLERITTAEGFDGFPMWSRDGKRLVFASNRNGSVVGETNLFVADWK